MKYILFDLGGVLFRMNGYNPLLRLFGQDMTREELHRKWVGCKSVQEFETGGVDFRSFSRMLVSEFEFDVAPRRFRDLFVSFQGEALPGANRLVSELRKSYRVGCLSNTNPPHIEVMKAASSLFEEFDDLFLSYEIGHIKPHAEAYLHVIEKTGVNPEDILFLDDSSTNVEAAAGVGMKACRVDSPQEAEAAVEKVSKTLLSG